VSTEATPSAAYGVAAVLGLVAALPGAAYVVWLVRAGPTAWTVGDVLVCLAIAAFGPLAVVLATVRMMRRIDRPVGIFVLTLVTTSVPTMGLFLLGTFAPLDSAPSFWLSLLGELAGVAAALIAIVAAIAKRVAAR